MLALWQTRGFKPSKKLSHQFTEYFSKSLENHQDGFFLVNVKQVHSFQYFFFTAL